ncbi:hypothetical protein B0T14DRAFT_608251 [Immersiella caudata]|uniref:Uncharacterized protein n=1 Tax=Immersiella caudata TaxID=314043 RepID=A0AA39TJJ6_9PEZI|nr:hypothetical protein B0T14DRAFT_608251 [Immersiella caudata]
MTKRVRGVEAIALNAVTAILLAILLGFAIFLNRGKPILFPLPNAAQRNPGWSTLDGVEPAAWNVIVVVIGTAVGIIASIAVTSQDAFLSRIELASARGVTAIFLRPLTTKRALDQFIRAKGRLLLSPERTALVLVLLTTALTSAATVALFSAQTVFVDVVNGNPSFPLSFLNNSYVRQRPDGSVVPIGVPTRQAQSMGSALNSFMYRSAFVNGQISQLGYHLKAPDPYGHDGMLPEPGLLGETTYNTVDLRGRYQHKVLSDGPVWGTTINATCTNQTDNYVTSRNINTGTDLWLTTAERKNWANNDRNLTVISNTVNRGSREGTLALGSKITSINPARDDDPLHVFLVAGRFNLEGAIFECQYSGREILVNVSMSASDAPLVIDTKSIVESIPIGPQVKSLVAQSINDVILGLNGGVLAKGFRDSTYNMDGDNNTDFASVLGTVLSQTAQASISYMRQMIEDAGLYNPPQFVGNPAHVTVRISILRIDGGPYLFGWLAVYVVLLAGAIGGVIRGAVGGRGVGFEAQDAFVEGVGLALEGKELTGKMGEGPMLLKGEGKNGVHE